MREETIDYVFFDEDSDGTESHGHNSEVRKSEPPRPYRGFRILSNPFGPRTVRMWQGDAVPQEEECPEVPGCHAERPGGGQMLVRVWGGRLLRISPDEGPP